MNKTEAIQILENIRIPFVLSIYDAQLGDRDAIEAYEDNQNCITALDVAIKELNKK